MVKQIYVFLNEKNTVLTLRWLLIITIIFLFLYPGKAPTENFSLVIGLVVVYFISNIILYFFPVKVFLSRKLNYLIFIFDIIFISIGIYLTQGFESDLYLAYFLVIFIAGIEANVKGSVLVTLVSVILYVTLYFRGKAIVDIYQASVLLRVVFLFMVALFISYLTERVKLHRRQDEQTKLQQEKNFILGESTVQIIHQVKSPLSKIATSVNLLLLKEEITNLRVKEELENIAQEAVHSGQLINDMFKFYQTQRLQQKETDLPYILDKVIAEEKVTLTENQIVLEKKYDKLLPHLYADGFLLSQVFANLIQNAIHSMYNGDGVGGNKTEHRLTVQIGRVTDFLQVKIRDTGSGISPENLNKIFLPFFTTKKLGTGLGLSICEDIITRHQGKIYFASDVGKGTTVTVDLPVKI